MCMSLLAEDPRPQYFMTIHAGKKIKIKKTTLSISVLAEMMMKLAFERAQTVQNDFDCNRHAINAVSRRWDSPGVGLVSVMENRHPSRTLLVRSECSAVGSVISTRRGLATQDLIPAMHQYVDVYIEAKLFIN